MATYTLVETVSKVLLEKGWMLTTAESCTGGGIAAVCTDLAGSSQWFERGFVSYSNQAKQDMLGVKKETLREYGAVSEAVVAEMVRGALTHSRAQVAVAVSGIAGPTGGTPDKPVGTVCFAWMLSEGAPMVCTEHLDGDRAAVRAQTIERALQGVLDVISGS